MAIIRFLQASAGRFARGTAGAVLIGLGAWLGGPWWVLAVVGLVPLGAALGNVCLFAPLFHEPLRPASTRPGAR